MTYTVEVDEDQMSELTRINLAESLERVLALGDDDEHTRALVASLVIVHEYYSTVEQHQQLIEELNDDLLAFDNRLIDDIMADKNSDDGFDVVDIIEHEDGSATINVDVDSEMLNQLASKGIEYTILQEMLGHPSMDEILRWIERGKQEENTDDIMKRFNEAKAQTESEEYGG